MVLPFVADVISRRIAGLRDTGDDRSKDLINRCTLLLRSFELTDIEALRAQISVLDRTLSSRPEAHYAKSADLTKALLRGKISSFAKRHRISEKDAANIYCDNRGFYEDKKIRKRNMRIYFFSIAAFTFLISFTVTYFSKSSPIIFFLLLFPISEAVKFITERIFSRLLPVSAVPRLKLDRIPDSAKTLTVITSLISSKDEALFRQLEEFYLSNREDNALFGLLLDLPESKEKNDDNDIELIDFAKENTVLLNEKYGDRFCLFIRDRVRSLSENKYMGYERKRGALIDLVCYLRGKGHDFAVFAGDKKLLSDIKYVVTLDRDTRLYSGAVRDMVSAMLHPDNTPVIKNGRVVSGYAIMQPHMATSLASFGKSYFSSLMSRGGVDPYQSAAFDLYQSLFAEGVFCGKGIFDVDVYSTLIPDAFSDGVILSHDLLEGSRLRCGVLSDVVLSDSHPATPSSFFKRMHRWIRGDIQSTLYAGAYVYDRLGRRIKNPISALSRFFIWDNVRRALVPLCACCVMLLSLLYPYSQNLLTLAALSYIIIPPILGIISSIGGLNRRFFSHVMPTLGNAVWDLLFGIASIFGYAFVSLDALIKGFVRSRITRKKTLEWSVSSLDTAGGFFAQISWSVLSYAGGFITLVFAQGSLLRSTAILWTLLPAILLFLSFDIPRAKKPSSSEKALLLRWLFDMWGFFSTYANEEENYLPPDNVQEFPSLIVAHRTSPTNIGMYLVSALAACDCGFIDPHTLCSRLEKTVTTLENLPKKHGHLYNWYDTKKLTVLGSPYISTVDSGNFVVSVTVLIEGLSEYEKVEPGLLKVKERLKNLADSADFSVLYSQKRKLFYIGMDAADEVSEENCYDLYMSEIRSTCYYAIARTQVPAEHWKKLGRPIIGHKGYLGVASWSGSMFEYFMPHLFLPSYEGSLSGEALAFAANAQIENRIKGFWGISESGYHAFDFAMNYQYRANGVPRLALDPVIGKEKVISPYSSFLCLGIARKAALKNLEKLRAYGAYGKHGFYEAIDFTPSRVGLSSETVKSYMSHHVGMSMISAANVCFDNIFIKRFMRNPEMSSVKELLCESIPTEAGVSKKSGAKFTENIPGRYHIGEKTVKTLSRNGQIPSVCMLSSDTASMTVSDAGHIMLARKDLLITRDPFDTRDMYSTVNALQIFCKTDKTAFQILPDTMSYTGSKIVFKNQSVYDGDKISSTLTFTLRQSEDMYCIKLDVNGKFTSFSPMIAFEVVLSKAEDRISHPFYNALSIDSFYSKEYGILTFHARSKNGEEDKWLGVSLEHYPLGFQFDTRAEILPLNYDSEDIKDLLFNELPSRTGACISPYCVLKGKPVECAGKISCEFVIAYGNSYEDLLRKYSFIRKNTGRDISSFFASSLHPLSQSRLALVNLAPNYLKYADYYLAALYFHPNNNPPQDKTFLKNALWAHGISGDLPIVAVVLPSDFSPSCQKICDTLIRLHRLCRIRGKTSDLVFIISESDGYNSHNKNRLSDIISRCGASELFCRYGGVFSISDKSMEDLFSSVSALFMRLERDSSIEELFHYFMKRSLRISDDIKIIKNNSFSSEETKESLSVYGGVFEKNGFSVDKSRAELVWSYIYSNRTFGTLLTQNSLGFTWFANAKEKRITPYFSSYRRDICGERLLLISDKNKKYDILASSHLCRFERGCAVYETDINDSSLHVEVGVDEKLQLKMVTVEVRGDLDLCSNIVYSVDPVIGEKVCAPNLIQRKEDGRVTFFRRRYDSHLSEHTVFLTSLEPEESIENGEKIKRYAFLFGIFPSFSDRAYYHMIQKYSSVADIKAGFEQYARFYDKLFSTVKLKSPDRALDIAINYYIPYQVFTARLFGRTGFYQSSGAYGFRDQLQDSLASLYYDPDFCKYQILRAAAHQYTEGDVQHWWHNSESGNNEGKWHAGLRSKCSDDLLWLPYTVARYLKFTGNYSILDLKVRYIESRELGENELTRYERPIRSKYRESLYNHCIRAIEHSLRFGRHGLPLIGSCDWNDGYDRVGHKGKGESVWLAQFMRMILSDFTVICQKRGDIEGAKKYSELCKELSATIEKEAFAGDRYLRGFYDSGKPLGAPGDKECEIDFLPQAFAAIFGGDPVRSKQAIDTACEKLWDREYGVVKLFTPPFSGNGDDPGYISAYCDGFRENGGQYTHAALWAVWGLLSVGEHSKAYEMLCDINPIARSIDKNTAVRYKTEPYALCGDVYANEAHLGRGGWSLYTGSASWFVQIVLGKLIGFSENGGKSFNITPKLSENFDSFELALQREGKETKIRARLAKKGEKSEILLDGKKTDNERENFFDDKAQLIEITVENL